MLAGRDDLTDAFVDAITNELEALNTPRPIDTLFIGGGTPTHLTGDQLEKLFDAIDRWLPRADGAETSVEANPEDLSAEMVSRLADRGVTRVSMGVQSFDDRKLKALERTHSRETITKAVGLCAQRIANISLDLIFGAPGESAADWRQDLRIATSLPIQHLSTYALTYEKGTSFWTKRFHGDLTGVGEETELEMYQDALWIVPHSGMKHYEISSFAFDGFRCRHNLAYWEGRGWFAFGPGAAKFVDGRREVNHRSTTNYIRRVQNGQSPVAESEAITLEQYACERAAFGIRMIDGIDLGVVHEETGVDVELLRGDSIQPIIAAGWVQKCARHYRLTEKGIFMADSVASAFLG